MAPQRSYRARKRKRGSDGSGKVTKKRKGVKKQESSSDTTVSLDFSSDTTVSLDFSSDSTVSLDIGSSSSSSNALRVRNVKDKSKFAKKSKRRSEKKKKTKSKAKRKTTAKSKKSKSSSFVSSEKEESSTDKTPQTYLRRRQSITPTRNNASLNVKKFSRASISFKPLTPLPKKKKLSKKTKSSKSKSKKEKSKGSDSSVQKKRNYFDVITHPDKYMVSKEPEEIDKTADVTETSQIDKEQVNRISKRLSLKYTTPTKKSKVSSARRARQQAALKAFSNESDAKEDNARSEESESEEPKHNTIHTHSNATISMTASTGIEKKADEPKTADIHTHSNATISMTASTGIEKKADEPKTTDIAKTSQIEDNGGIDDNVLFDDSSDSLGSVLAEGA